MNNIAVRWRNFRCFRDTGWIELAPLTVVIGPNSGGKTSLVAPLLLMKQTLDTNDQSIALRRNGELLNAGQYRDMVFDHDPGRALRFDVRMLRSSSERSRGRRLSALRPDRLELTFESSESVSGVSLRSAVIMGPDGRANVSRRRLPSGRYTCKLRESLPASNEFERTVTRAIRRAMPNHFYFSSDDAGAAIGEWITGQTTDKLAEDGENRAKVERMEFPFPPAYGQYLANLAYVERQAVQVLNSVRYIGPLRAPPRRSYETVPEIRDWVGARGEYAAPVLHRMQPGGPGPEVEKWLNRFEFGDRVKCEPHDQYPDIFSVSIVRDRQETNLADAGFGLSQVFPLIVQSFAEGESRTVVAEQPEIHLNPKLQVTLADMFAALIDRGHHAIVETHSEHLVLRLRTLIAEGHLAPDQVALYFVEHGDGQSTVRRVPIEENGHIALQRWPKGFFDEPLRGALDLAAAQIRRG